MWAYCAKWKIEKNNHFYGEMINVSDMHSVDDLHVCLSEFNGHLVRHTDGFDSIHRKYGAG